VNEPAPGTAAFTYTVLACWAVASTMLAVVTPARVMTSDFPAATVTMPLRENTALPLT